MHVRAHTGFAGNEFADVGAELGRRLQCTSLSWLWTVHSARREGVVISLYDALWWTDQLAKPDPMTERDGTRPSVERKLELWVGSDACSRKHIDVVGLQETRARN